MNNTGNYEQFDADILRCKVDILRARDTITSQDDTAKKNSKTQNSDTDSNEVEMSTNEDTNPTDLPQIPIEEIPANEPIAPLRPEAGEKKAEISEKAPEIPSFDLAEEIMAEQRRITAIRRKAPGEKAEVQKLKPEIQPVDHIIKEPKPELSKQEKIIAEIVSRDIERLCQGDYSTNSK